MNILVLIKEVPDMEKVRFDREKGVVDRSSAPAEMNPFDESALQAALDIKERDGSRVTVMTMGPRRAEATLKDAYARGADEAVIISDRAFGGSDTYATSKSLAAAIKTGSFDLILCGEKSVDGDTAQVGAEVAALLGIPHCYYADSIKTAGGWAEVGIENLCGRRQVRKMKLPALIGVTKNIARLKLPTVDRKLASMEAEVKLLTLADMQSLTKDDVGFSGSPTKVAKIEVPQEKTRESVMYRDDFDGFAEALWVELCARGVN